MNESAYGLCVQNTNEGAKRLGNIWAIPKDEEKPVDDRYKKIGRWWKLKISEIDEWVKNSGAAEK